MKRRSGVVRRLRLLARGFAIAAVGLALAAPVFAQANSPWENAVNVLQLAFTSTIARGLSLVAIVVSGLTFAFGEGGSKRVIAGVLFGVGMAIAAVNFLAWLFPARLRNSQKGTHAMLTQDESIRCIARVSRPLTILGAERKLFFFAMCVGAGTFNLLGSLLGRSADVPAALRRRPLGHRDRSADSATAAGLGETPQPVRPCEIRSRPGSQDSSCLGSNASSRITRTLAHSTPR